MLYCHLSQALSCEYRIFMHVARGFYNFLHGNGHPAGYTKVYGVKIFFDMIHSLCQLADWTVLGPIHSIHGDAAAGRACTHSHQGASKTERQLSNCDLVCMQQMILTTDVAVTIYHGQVPESAALVRLPPYILSQCCLYTGSWLNVTMTTDLCLMGGAWWEGWGVYEGADFTYFSTENVTLCWV